jgi:hypothetical protein
LIDYRRNFAKWICSLRRRAPEGKTPRETRNNRFQCRGWSVFGPARYC